MRIVWKGHRGFNEYHLFFLLYTSITFSLLPSAFLASLFHILSLPILNTPLRPTSFSKPSERQETPTRTMSSSLPKIAVIFW